MAWTNSKVFREFVHSSLGNIAAFNLVSDSFLVALYDNDITPDQDASAANTAYNAGAWVTTGNEMFEAGQWAQGGVALTSQALDKATAATVFFDAADTASGSAADLATVFGCLVYDDTLGAPVANQGVSFHYFGGSNSVTNGTLTVVWHANGIDRFAL